MKNLMKAATVVLVAFMMACSGGGDTPKAVAENFLKSYSKLDFDGAKKYGTEETGKLLDMMSSLTKMMPDSAKKEVKTEITAEKVDGDKATVTYKEAGKDGDQTLNLVKVDGKWKVAMSKDGMNGGSGAGGMDSGATTMDSTASAASADTTKK
ncbi:MAG: DUF4878 domain-containing protein [Bacteroidetes bacterium]|nr:DUF4878 domain-containing protein [Bacteroidota bacterium]